MLRQMQYVGLTGICEPDIYIPNPLVILISLFGIALLAPFDHCGGAFDLGAVFVVHGSATDIAKGLELGRDRI